MATQKRIAMQRAKDREALETRIAALEERVAALEAALAEPKPAARSKGK
jgi:uncharacterized protein YceH (UPF0502 family)